MSDAIKKVAASIRARCELLERGIALAKEQKRWPEDHKSTDFTAWATLIAVATRDLEDSREKARRYEAEAE